MRDFMDKKLLGLQMNAQNYLKQLLEEEDGDTNFVSIIVIIVIVLGIAAIFREQLTDAVELVFGQLFDFIG